MNSTLFTDAMALTPAGDGVYDGELNEHWTIGPRVHGGAMLAVRERSAHGAFQWAGGTSRAQRRGRLGGEPERWGRTDRGVGELPVGA
jgi:hypothetical protein